MNIHNFYKILFLIKQLQIAVEGGYLRSFMAVSFNKVKAIYIIIITIIIISEKKSINIP